jgi:hypothetical protein
MISTFPPLGISLAVAFGLLKRSHLIRAVNKITLVSLA